MLQVPAVDVHDNFFDIGGHSISATRLVFQMRQALKVDLPLTTVCMLALPCPTRSI